MSSELTLHSGDILAHAKRWSDLDEAERKRRAVEALRDRDLEQLWELTEAHLTLWGRQGSRVSKATLRAYKTSIRIFLEETQDANLYRYRPGDAAIYIRGLEASGLASATVSVRLAGARALYAALRWAGAVETDPFRDVRPAKDKTAAWDKRQPYSDGDIAVLAAAAGLHDRAMILFGAHAGLRVSEILKLEWRDIDLGERRVHVREGKGRKSRRPAMSGTLCDAVRALSRDSDRLFPFTSQEQARVRLKQLCKRTNVAYLGIHALRHSCGTRIYRETGKLENAQHHLGHSDISTTSVYAKWSDETVRASVGGW